jgi:uncharacterized protein Smg (DUF494 family)
MAHATNEQEMLLQNLKDAGCDQQTIKNCLALFQQKNTSEMKRLLAKHKQKLLETIHIHQKEIDCLDYLIFRLDQSRI